VPRKQSGVTWTEAGGKVLLVDDDPTLVKSMARALRAKGYDVVSAHNGEDAVRYVTEGEFDAIISDIAMPGMDGIQLLREVRDHDLYVPVILMTGEPAVSTAVKAVEYGAFHYLTKPMSLEDVTQVLGRAVGLSRMARVKHEAAELLGNLDGQVADRAGLEAAFERALANLWVAFQPIIRADHSVYAYEALMRSESSALPHPGAVIGAAERLGALNVLGRLIRARAAEHIAKAPGGANLFVNCHPLDLMDDDLYCPEAPLSQQARRVVLEVTERSSLDEVKDVRGRVAELRALGFRIAVDDFGAGYAGLTSFAQLEPEIVKMDLSIVRDVEKSHIKQKVIRSTTTLAKDMGILVVAEGVETVDERNCLLDLGVDLLQGFLFAKPGRPFPRVSIPPQLSPVGPTEG
jgi:EAL domain-containing protein (putative c-di-GMP-specific phosphodiesterase class I)/ActR/RegA family two-component response regulator